MNKKMQSIIQTNYILRPGPQYFATSSNKPLGVTISKFPIFSKPWATATTSATEWLQTFTGTRLYPSVLSRLPLIVWERYSFLNRSTIAPTPSMVPLVEFPQSETRAPTIGFPVSVSHFVPCHPEYPAPKVYQNMPLIDFCWSRGEIVLSFGSFPYPITFTMPDDPPPRRCIVLLM